MSSLIDTYIHTFQSICLNSMDSCLVSVMVLHKVMAQQQPRPPTLLEVMHHQHPRPPQLLEVMDH